jgi:hypothetical protein
VAARMTRLRCAPSRVTARTERLLFVCGSGGGSVLDYSGEGTGVRVTLKDGEMSVVGESAATVDCR